AQSWLRFEFFDVQASELCKVIMILTLAHVLSGDRYDLNGALPLILAIVLLVPPLILIYLQPDFGTALILAATWVGMVVLAGVRWQYLLILGMAGAALAPLIWFRLEGYMQARILHFFFPDNDPTGASYNINQALISIGSGGWWGKGLFHGTQSQLQFLRVRHTDFIFSVLAEETGFVGASFLVILFTLLILRLVRVARIAPDHDGRLIASGVAVMIFTQTFINIGMNANILPVTGLPLPLVSYGGSALVTLLIALGIAQSVAMRHKPPEEPLLPLGR
ncbi:MAG: rod shape-determining protein RodA, partial [Chloroflexi bacterium]|nr:rod shape-determining protein RodA [Chloroflexota bacterium]